jgi:pimeloyl-ACP methyl ester carboxylesterase
MGEDNMESEKKVIKLLGTELYYEACGEGIPLLVIHGWGVDHHLMSGCMEPVFEKSIYKVRRIYIDLPGMGKSKASEFIKSSDDILNVIITFIDEVIPNQQFILAGESYGGYLSRALIQKRSKNILGLLLLCPLIYPGNRQGDVPPLKVIEKDNNLLGGLSEIERTYFEYMTIVQNDKIWERYKRDILDALLNQDSYFLNHVLEGAFSYNIGKLEQPFEKPSLILVGRQDTEVGYKDQFGLLEDYPRASYVVLDKAGHNLQIEQYELFGYLVCEWIERVITEI